MYLKYFLFYILMMFKNDNYALISVENLKTFQDIVYYCFIFLALPTLFTVVLTVPIYYTFKLNNLHIFSGLIFILLAIECLVYTYLASQLDYLNGVYLLIISVLVLTCIFYKAIISKHSKI